MKITYSHSSDAIFIRLDETKKIVDSQEVQGGVILDFDDQGKVIGVEILKVKDRIPPDQLKEIKFQVAN